ncbi:MAG: hypothetical protein AAB403_11660, partial [Planctomycetota bacterium]
MTKTLRIGLIVSLTLAAGTAMAFNGHIAAEGPLEMTIGPIADVESLGEPREVKVTLANKGQSPLAVHLRMAGLVDEWYAVGETERDIVVAPSGTAETMFSIAAREGACSALYPVHIYAEFQDQDRTVTAHAVQILKSSF